MAVAGVRRVSVGVSGCDVREDQMAEETGTVDAAWLSSVVEGIPAALFVVGPDGRITARIMKFNVLSGEAYTELGNDVAATLKPSGGGGSH